MPALSAFNGTAMIEATGLSKRYARLTAVDGISFKVEPGEVLGFLGPNGAGKSTTMKIIAGFLLPSSGSARVCGHDVQAEPMAARRALGYLPEGAPSYGEMTPRSLLAFIADLRGLGGGERLRRLDFVVSRLSLESVLNQSIETLSKGFRRRVGLAVAILHDPAALILDEPTDGLDPNQKHEVRGLITELAKERTLLLSTHILEEVEAVCTRAIIIARGQDTRRRHAGRAAGAFALSQCRVPAAGGQHRRARRARRHARRQRIRARRARVAHGAFSRKARPSCRKPWRSACGSAAWRFPAFGSSGAASMKYSGASRRRRSRHERDPGHLPPRVRQLFRHAAGSRLHRHLPVAERRLHFLPRRFLRDRAGGPAGVLPFPSRGCTCCWCRRWPWACGPKSASRAPWSCC